MNVERTLLVVHSMFVSFSSSVVEDEKRAEVGKNAGR